MYILGVLVYLYMVLVIMTASRNFVKSERDGLIASCKTIMLVGMIGVMLGATFSSCMSESARSGVFNPQMFTFSAIMVIFCAVMVTDIILLDLFNSLGLPTSTTVSIVFELLGSALAAAAYTLLMDGASLANVIDYINSSKSLAIVSGILISVAVAFVTGAVVQYITRLIFTFNFEKMYRRVGGVFAGIALTAIFYFLVMKGAKGASFMQPEWIQFMNENTWPIVGTLFVVLSVVFHLLIIVCNVNIFKIVILAGTFSLAFAFAGNDLVNFVGVPLAAWDSYQEWVASGAAAEAFTMDGFLKPTAAATGFLLFSGLVMVLTFWFSQNAQIVIQTPINPSSSTSGEQAQFGSSLPCRMILPASLGLRQAIHQIITISF